MTLSALWRYPSSILAGAAMMWFALPYAPQIAADFEDRLAPVVTDWRVTDAQVFGADLVLRGTMIKRRSCTFLPPTVARDEAGQNHAVRSTSPTAGQTWAPAESPQRWGPWTIVGGAGKRLEFANVYACHGGWPSFTDLGVFDGRATK
jgi:hypothetical protein